MPRPYALAAVARILAPGLVRRVLSGGAASSLTTSTAAESPTGLRPRPDRPRSSAAADAAEAAVVEVEDELMLLAELPLRSARIDSWVALIFSPAL